MAMIKKVNKCRICRSRSLRKFLSLGPSPLANSFLDSSTDYSRELFYPLDVCYCTNCSLVQLGHVVDADLLYRDYIYIPSTANTMLIHFAQLAAQTILNFNLTSSSFVVDIGSNDGTLLKHFKIHGMKTLGIDPASNLAAVASRQGIETIEDFFNKKAAQRVFKEKGKADVITATNVFAHMDDIHEFLSGIEILLSDNGIFIIEFPYLLDLIKKNEFDTIYHEHLSYFSIRPLVNLFSQFDLEIFDLERISIHGGSLRVYIKKSKRKKKNKSPVIQDFMAIESHSKLHKFSTYVSFAKRVKKIRSDLNNLLLKLKQKNMRIAAVGAPAKGNTLLNYCGIGSDILMYIADSTPTKWKKLTPGMHIPIFDEKKILLSQPDYLLILAWNFADEIMKKQDKFKKKGGKFILPIPSVEIIS